MDVYASQMTGMELSTQLVLTREVTLEDVQVKQALVSWMAVEMGQ